MPDKGASDPQSGAIDDYQKALQELERLLKQLREEEMERLLAQLQQRCEYMLQMQKEVRDATVQIEDAVGKNRDKKPTRADIQRSQGQADKEGEIAKEARKAKALVDAEGTAVAFSEIFGQLVRDMEDVQRRLAKGDTGLVTVRIETDIIQMLEQMIEALKQAQKDMKNKPSKDGGGGGQSQQKLLELVHELKLVKFRQVVINNRTIEYHKQYPKDEQADKPDIQKEVKKLGEDESNLRKIIGDMIKNLSSK